MGGRRQDFLFPSEFHDPAMIHRGNPVGHLRDQGKIMADQEQRETVPLFHQREQVENLDLNHRINGARGLIGNDQLRIVAYRQRDPHTLTDTAGQFKGIEFPVAFGDAHFLEQVRSACSSLFVRKLLMRLKCFYEVVLNGKDRIQGTADILKNNADLIAEDFSPACPIAATCASGPSLGSGLCMRDMRGCSSAFSVNMV